MVIVILAVLSAVVVFAIRGSGDKGSSAALASDAKTVRTAEEAFCGKLGRYGTAPELVDQQFLSDPPTLTQLILRPYPSSSGGAPCGTPPNQATYYIACATNQPGCGPDTGTSATILPYNSVGSLSPAPLPTDAGRRLGGKMTAMSADVSGDGVPDVWASVGSDADGCQAIWA